MSKLNDFLIASGEVDQATITKMEEIARAQSIPFLYALEKTGALPDKKCVELFSKYYGVDSIDLDTVTLSDNVLAVLPKDMIEKFLVIPIEINGKNLKLATTEPKNHKVIDAIRFKTRLVVKPVLASGRIISKLVEREYKSKIDLGSFAGDDGDTPVNEEKDDRIEIGNISEDGDDGPVIRVVNQVLKKCLSSGGSDIHFEPYETFVRIRIRIDGSLVEVARPPILFRDGISSRIKIMAKMDIAEKRRPQDGGISVLIDGKPIDFRVSSVPTVYGEKIVLRILDKSALEVDMTKLGFEQDDLDKFKGAIHKPYGMVLVTGPTGSGKTTTLYSALAELNQVTENITTAEDPVEFQLEGVNQVHVKASIGFTFAKALKAFLRQDPDIIMVGEIRDLETSNIAMKAALTGHMVLSTLHTNSAADTIIRLLNMGVEGFNLISALNCIVAQRLARRICSSCKIVDDTVGPDELIVLGIPERFATKVKAYKGAGCEVCNYGGNKGRTALHEVMIVNEDVKKGILAGLSAIDLKKIAMRTGMRTLRQNALKKLVSGVINASEVVANSAPDSDNAAKTKSKTTKQAS